MRVITLFFICSFLHLNTKATTIPGQPQLNINIFRSSDNSFADGIVALFNTGYSSGIGPEDATKFTNFSETFSLSRDGNFLSIEGRPLITSKDTLFFGMSNFTKRTYYLSISSSDFTSTLAYIEDRYTGTKQPIDLAATSTYSFTVNNDANSSDNNRFIITFINTANFAMWQGTVSNDWGTAANWSTNAVPASSSDVLILSATNQPAIATGYQFAVKSLEVGAGITFTLNNTSVLTAGSYIINNGVINGNGKLSLNGFVSQSITGNGTYGFLELNNGMGAIIASGNTVSLVGGFLPSAGALTVLGTLVLKSSATNTAYIGQGTGSYITGNVTVERFIPSNTRKKYTLVSSPVSGQTMYTAWQEGGNNAISGYGTIITGASVGNGFDDVSASGLASVFTYNDNNAVNNKWVGLANTDATNLASGGGYLLFVRGDRSITPSVTTGNNTILRSTGALTTGNVVFSSSLTTGINKFSLIANPYPATINWNSAGITKTGLNNAFTVYDPNLGIFVTSNGTVKSPNSGNQQAGYIQSGQAFFIQTDASGTTPSITFTEAAKTTAATSSASTTVFGNSTTPQININVFDSNSATLTDGVVAIFDKTYSNSIDKNDAVKIKNFAETFYLSRDNQPLAIESRPAFATNDTLFFGMDNFSKKTYMLQISGDLIQGMNAYLVDNFLQTRIQVNTNGITQYPFNVTNDALSFGNDRFYIVLEKTSTNVVTDRVTTSTFAIGPNPAMKDVTIRLTSANTLAKKTILIINSLGQTIKQIDAGNTNNASIQVNVEAFSAGTYTVQLLEDGNVVTTKKMVRL